MNAQTEHMQKFVDQLMRIMHGTSVKTTGSNRTSAPVPLRRTMPMGAAKTLKSPQRPAIASGASKKEILPEKVIPFDKDEF